jgi:large subunit ribosomal protein L24
MGVGRSHIKKGDTVLVLSGKDSGKQGKVLQVMKAKQRAVVEGLNIITKHMRPSADSPEGGRVEIEGTIHISNLKLICPKTSQPIRTKRITTEKEINGRIKKFRIRVSRKTGKVID